MKKAEELEVKKIFTEWIIEERGENLTEEQKERMRDFYRK